MRIPAILKHWQTDRVRTPAESTDAVRRTSEATVVDLAWISPDLVPAPGLASQLVAVCLVLYGDHLAIMVSRAVRQRRTALRSRYGGERLRKCACVMVDCVLPTFLAKCTAARSARA